MGDELVPDVDTSVTREEKESKSVFISYGRADALDFAKRLATDLEKRGRYEVWMDLEGIEKGGLFEVRIEQGIRLSSVILALMTPHALREESVCRDEVVFALNEGKTIVPIRVASYPDMKPTLLLARRQWIDFAQDYEQALASLFAYLGGDDSVLCMPTLPIVTGFTPIDFGPEIAKYTAAFVGREWLNRELDLWLNSQKGRAFVIIGEPGVGKSAIAAWLSQVREKQVAAMYFCTQRNTRTLDPYEFVACLVSQLCTQLDGYMEVVQESFPERRQRTGADAFRELIVEPTRRMPAKPAPSMIIVDSLDEAFMQDGETIVDILADQVEDLPPWLRIVATTRPVAGVLDLMRKLNTFELQAESMDNLMDLAQYIGERLGNLDLERSSGKETDRIASLLENLAEGNFLYARMAIDAMENGTLEIEDLGELAPGLCAYYSRLFYKTFPDTGGFASDYRPILETLAVAQAPLPVNLLKSMVCQPLEILYRRLRTLRPYLHISGRGMSAEYTLFHKSVKDWLTDPDSAGDYWCNPDSGHERIADLLCDHWQGSEYALRYLPRHLTALSRIDELVSLFNDADYINAGIECRVAGFGEDLDSLLTDLNSMQSSPMDKAKSLFNQACIFISSNELTKARDLLIQQERILREQGHLLERAHCLATQAVVEQKLGNVAEQMELLKAQEKISREIGNGEGLVESLGNQANILQTRGDLDSAMNLHKEQEKICRELGNPDELQRSLGNQALILKTQAGLRHRGRRKRA